MCATIGLAIDASISLAAIVLEGVQLPLRPRYFWRLPADDPLLAIENPEVAALVGEATEVRLRQKVMELGLVRQRREPAPLSRQRCNFTKHLRA